MIRSFATAGRARFLKQWIKLLFEMKLLVGGRASAPLQRLKNQKSGICHTNMFHKEGEVFPHDRGEESDKMRLVKTRMIMITTTT
jgi:hypothetical protein